jgi:hypothetical protein
MALHIKYKAAPNALSHISINYIALKRKIVRNHAVTRTLSLLNKQEMHRCVCNDDEGSRDHGQPGDVERVRLRVEAKSAQNRGTRYFNIQTVLVVDQGKEGDLVNDEGLEAVVKDG